MKRAISLTSFSIFLVLLLYSCSNTNDETIEAEKNLDEITIQLAHESPDTHVKGVWAEHFKKEVEERSDNNIKVELFHQGSLYADEQAALEAVSKGVIQMGISSTGYISSIEPSYEVFDLPMLFEKQETLNQTLDGSIGEELLNNLTNSGMKGLGYITGEPLSIFSIEPIESLEDIKNQKLRVHTALLEKTVNSLGGNPITIAADEMYLSLQQGVLDGVLTTTSYAAPNKLSEVVNYMLDAKVSSIVYPIVINNNFWEDLSDEQQKLIEESIEVAVEKNREELSDSIEGYKSTLENEGVQIDTLSDEDREKWQEATRDIYDQFENQNLIEEIQNN